MFYFIFKYILDQSMEQGFRHKLRNLVIDCFELWVLNGLRGQPYLRSLRFIHLCQLASTRRSITHPTHCS